MDTPATKRFAVHAIVHRGTNSEYFDPSYGNTITGPTNFTPYIGAWGILRNGMRQWKPAAGSELQPAFRDQ
jgi:hypothetical protein